MGQLLPSYSRCRVSVLAPIADTDDHISKFVESP